MPTETQQEKYARWVRAVNYCAEHNWQCVHGWVFRSPSDSLHDLSAADLSQLDRIEGANLFWVNPDFARE